MAVDVHANLKTAAMARVRMPIWQVLFDWDDVGFAAGFADPDNWTNEGDYLISIMGEMSCTSWHQSMSPLGPSSTGTCTVVLNNLSNRFSNADPTSTLYSKIGGTKIRYKRVIIRAGYYYNGVWYYCSQIAGYVVAMSETDNSKKVSFTIQDRGVEMQSTKVWTQMRSGWPSTYIAELVGSLTRDKLAADGGYGESYIDSGLFPLPWMWADGESMWDELNALALANMGLIFWDKSGNFHFHDGSYWCKANSTAYRSPLTSQATFTSADYVAVVPSYDVRRSYSKITVEYTGRYLGALQQVYDTPDVWLIPPGESQTFTCIFRNPVDNILVPVPNEDYTVISSGGIDLSADVTLSFEYYATQCAVTATNNHASLAALICGMTFRGWPSIARKVAKYDAVDSAPVVENTWKPAVNPYIQSLNQAQAIADFALARYNSPMHGVRIVGAKMLPWLEVGDRITVTGGGLDPAHSAYFVVKINWSTGYPFLMDVEAVRADDLYPGSDYFCVGGGSGYTGHKYGHVTGKGYLFW